MKIQAQWKVVIILITSTGVALLLLVSSMTFLFETKGTLSPGRMRQLFELKLEKFSRIVPVEVSISKWRRLVAGVTVENE